MKRIIFVFIAAIVASMVMVACNGTNASNETSTIEVKVPNSDCKVEVIYFHGKQRCMTCMSIEKETRFLMEGELAEQVKSGKVKMRVVDFSTIEGKTIAKKYKVTFSSLFVVTNPGQHEKSEDLTRFAFANARSNPEVFRKEVKAKVLNAIK